MKVSTLAFKLDQFSTGRLGAKTRFSDVCPPSLDSGAKFDWLTSLESYPRVTSAVTLMIYYHPVDNKDTESVNRLTRNRVNKK